MLWHGYSLFWVSGELPIVLAVTLVPVLVWKGIGKRSIVERLREE